LRLGAGGDDAALVVAHFGAHDDEPGLPLQAKDVSVDRPRRVLAAEPLHAVRNRQVLLVALHADVVLARRRVLLGHAAFPFGSRTASDRRRACSVRQPLRFSSRYRSWAACTPSWTS